MELHSTSRRSAVSKGDETEQLKRNNTDKEAMIGRLRHVLGDFVERHPFSSE